MRGGSCLRSAVQLTDKPRWRQGARWEAIRLPPSVPQENPGDPIGPFCTGRALEEMGRASAALSQYKRAAAMPVDSFGDRFLNPADVQKQMGISAQEMRNYPEAIRHFEQYLLLNPEDSQRAATEQTQGMLRENRR